MPYQPKTCAVCSASFQPTSGKQWRCISCSKSDARVEKAPRCACGCKQRTRWSRTTASFRTFVHGHALRDRYNRLGAKAMPTHEPWNKGTAVTHQLTCTYCNEIFIVADPLRKFCSLACSRSEHQGAGSPLWKGGVRTKYKHQSDGQRVHRVLMAAHLGRPLRSKEVVHHIDENGLNNELSNLHLFHCDRCHNHFHRSQGDAVLRYKYRAIHPK